MSMRIAKQGELTLDVAQDLKSELLDSLRRQEPVTLDLEAVKEVDLACLQVLLAARRTFARHGRQLEIRPGECVGRTWAEAGYPAGGDENCRKPS